MAENKKNVPVTNELLKQYIDDLKANPSKENQVKMYTEARNASLLVPVIFSVDFKANETGKINIPKGTQIKFVLVNTNQGKSFFPAFTDIEEAKKLKVTQEGNLQYVVRKISEYEKILEDPNCTAEGIVINPMTQNIVLPKQLVMGLNKVEQIVEEQKKAVAQGAMPAGVQVRFSEPTVYPTAMVNAVHEYCEKQESIKRVWLKSMIAGTAMSFVLIVDSEEVTPASVTALHDCAVPFSKDIPVIVLKYTEELEKKAVQGAFPLYDAELGL